MRTTDYLANLRQHLGRASQDELVAVPLAGELWAVCVVDRPHATEPLSLRGAAELGLSRGAALALCKGNLAAALPRLREVADAPRDGTSNWLNGDGDYEAGRLLLQEEWATLAQAILGHLVVAAPHTGLILYGDAELPGTVEAIRLHAKEAAQ